MKWRELKKRRITKRKKKISSINSSLIVTSFKRMQLNFRNNVVNVNGDLSGRIVQRLF